MKVITINIDKESVLQEIQMLDGIQVKVPDTMSNEDVEKMMINHVPELHKYYYDIHEGEDEYRRSRKIVSFTKRLRVGVSIHEFRW